MGALLFDSLLLVVVVLHVVHAVILVKDCHHTVIFLTFFPEDPHAEPHERIRILFHGLDIKYSKNLRMGDRGGEGSKENKQLTVSQKWGGGSSSAISQALKIDLRDL